MNGVDRWFYTHCKCRTTDKNGFYTTQSSSNHIFWPTPPKSSTENAPTEESETPEANLTAVDDVGADDGNALCWEGYMSLVKDCDDLDVDVMTEVGDECG